MATREDDGLPNLLYAFSAIFSVLAAAVVALRFLAKPKSNRRVFLDDWLIVFSLASFLVFAIFVVYGVAVGGLGRPLMRDANGDPIYGDEFFRYQKTSYVTNAVQITALGPTKLAVLFLYRRIFSVNSRRFNVISYIMIFLVIAWTIAFFFVNIFTYMPISDMWTKQPGQSHRTFKDPVAMYNAQCFSDVVLDVTILTLPIPQVWRLQISLARRLQICGIFMLGIITIAASVARSIVQYRVAEEFEKGNPDQTYYLCPHIYWTMIEQSMGIVAASLPLLRPLGRIYSLRNILAASAKAFSTIFTMSSRSQTQTGHEYPSKAEEEDVSRLTRENDSQNDRWLRRYDMSCLDQTIDNESRIEAHAMTNASDWATGEGIRYEKRYEVIHGDAVPRMG